MIVLAGLFLANLVSAQPQTRTALVIGNANYVTSPLENPSNDAQDLALVLGKLNFQVTLLLDLDRRGMKLAIRNFAATLQRRGGVGFFYYAGHAVEVGGDNFLIPLGADIPNENYVDLEGVSLREVTAGLSYARNHVNIIVLDACRNNPYTRRWRSGSRGLRKVGPPAETLIAFAAASGQVASDGLGSRNSPYARVLIEEIQRPGIRLVDVFRRVKARVRAITNGEQSPWQSDDLTSDATNAFYFVPANSTERLFASLEIKSNVSDNEVRVDGVLIASTGDGIHEIAPGPHTIQVAKNGYVPFERTLMLEAGAREILSAVLDRSPPTWPPMVEVPAGNFYSGCFEKADTECDADEKPGRTRRLERFQMDTTEVTVSAFGACVAAGACEAPSSSNGCNWKAKGRDNHPVNCIDWFQAKAFCEWLGKRLPTEWEWEKAARGTDGRKYAWGNQSFLDGSAKANIADRNTDFDWRLTGYDDGYADTSPVGSYLSGASPFGALDMIGNVWEWTISTYPKSGRRVVRGGSWRYPPNSERASSRDRFAAGMRSNYVGFRCAR